MAASPDIAPAPIGIPNRPAASASGGLGSPSRAAGSAVRRASSQFTGPSDWSIRMTSLRSIFDMSKIDLNEVMRMLQSDGPVNWELARRTALPAALDGEPADPAVSPEDHSQLAELVRAAQTLVVAETGLTATFGAPLRT